jgi:hypothetical protein
MNPETPREGTSERLKMLLTELDEEADRLLCTHKIWTLHGYAWDGLDTPSDEYVGLAMWELNPPFEPDWQALMNRGQIVDYEPTKRDEVLLQNGEDFVGTMEFARQSLGMALCYASVGDQKYNIFGKAPFWQSVATTLTWLNVASDRLRDYFLMAAFGQKKGTYSESYKTRNQTKESPPFAVPFEQAATSALADKKQILGTLVDLARKFQSYRKDRNAIVHEIASKSAEASISNLKEQRELAKTRKPRQFEHLDMEELVARDKADTTVPSEIERMKTWYACLVKAGSLIFEFEYRNRK